MISLKMCYVLCCVMLSASIFRNGFHCDARRRPEVSPFSISALSISRPLAQCWNIGADILGFQIPGLVLLDLALALLGD